MFKLNFGEISSNDENDSKQSREEDALAWLPAERLAVPESYNGDAEDAINLQTFDIKVLDPRKVTSKLAASNCDIISEAEAQHSDLLPAKYEGGLKIWECTYDLGSYLLEQNISFSNKVVLDLGCGAGILGIIALLRGSRVDFQDYNAEVIHNVTIPNVTLNCGLEVAKKCNFYCGDWKSFENLLCKDKDKEQYDYIFTSETIYNSENHYKLYNVFKNTLKKDGTGYVAGKCLYFGVGGTMRQFEQLVLEDGIFDISTVWKSDIGVQREVLKLQRKSSI